MAQGGVSIIFTLLRDVYSDSWPPLKTHEYSELQFEMAKMQSNPPQNFLSKPSYAQPLSKCKYPYCSHDQNHTRGFVKKSNGHLSLSPFKYYFLTPGTGKSY